MAAVTFVELLTLLGGMGRFQLTYVGALAIPLFLLASHNLLQNFTAGVPEHYCRPRLWGNATNMADVPLVVSIPSDGQRGLQRCRRYVEPQWQLLGGNGTGVVGLWGYGVGATEPCRDGWIYRDGVFAHTIISEVYGVGGVEPYKWVFEAPPTP
uniref:Uncharacterized protein n=1 Tax=Coturnix japonica TaxID=93934 RepID=A0A8C2SZP8_COTJA